MSCLSLSQLLSSCRSDDEPTIGDLSFGVEHLDEYLIPSEGIASSAFGNGKKFVVRANGNWELQPIDPENDSWARIFPLEGRDDGYIRIYADENLVAKNRTASFRVLINGIEQPETLTLTQQSCRGFMNISTSLLTFRRGGGELSVQVSANLDWECHIEDDAYNTFECSEILPTTVVVKAGNPNDTGEEIHAKLIISSIDADPQIRYEIDLVQLYALFFDDFSWLECQSGILGWAAASGFPEIRIDKWTAAEKSHGWSSLSNWVYARSGFVKFGKGGYGGDLISPAIPDLDVSTDAIVSWKALGYSTKKNVKDDIESFYVAILGNGNITGCSEQGSLGYNVPYKDAAGLDITLKAARFSFTENAWMMPALDESATVIWQVPDAQFSIEVNGLDKNSRIIFISGNGTIAGEYANENAANSRFFLDDFKIITK